jgi:putative SOS response-associated peptidase YedK
MCGRKTLTKGKIEIIQDMLVDDWGEDWIPSYNIAPTQNTPILLFNEKRFIKTMRWGLIPSWAKDIKIGNRLINARSDTLSEKPSFQKLLQSNRCVIITDGYYEWRQTNNGKIPYYIHHPHNNILPMAGLWDRWIDENNKEYHTYTVITTEPAQPLAHIHNRMPVILNFNELDDWVSAKYSAKETLNMLDPFTHPLEFYPVSNFVNSPRNNSEICIQPIIQETS